MDKSISTVSIYNRIANQYAGSFKESALGTSIIMKFIKSLAGNKNILDIGC